MSAAAADSSRFTVSQEGPLKLVGTYMVGAPEHFTVEHQGVLYGVSTLVQSIHGSMVVLVEPSRSYPVGTALSPTEAVVNDNAVAWLSPETINLPGPTLVVPIPPHYPTPCPEMTLRVRDPWGIQGTFRIAPLPTTVRRIYQHEPDASTLRHGSISMEASAEVLPRGYAQINNPLRLRLRTLTPSAQGEQWEVTSWHYVPEWGRSLSEQQVNDRFSYPFDSYEIVDRRGRSQEPVELASVPGTLVDRVVDVPFGRLHHRGAMVCTLTRFRSSDDDVVLGDVVINDGRLLSHGRRLGTKKITTKGGLRLEFPIIGSSVLVQTEGATEVRSDFSILGSSRSRLKRADSDIVELWRSFGGASPGQGRFASLYPGGSLSQGSAVGRLRRAPSGRLETALRLRHKLVLETVPLRFVFPLRQARATTSGSGKR